MTNAQRKAIFGMCKTLSMSEDDRRALICSVTGREYMTLSKAVKEGEVEMVAAVVLKNTLKAGVMRGIKVI